VNKATATGKPPVGPNVTAEDTWTADVIRLAEIGDFVWWDVNGNGQQEGGEPGIKDVTVYLYNSAGGLAGTDVTDANGKYSFSFLADGSYTVKIALNEFAAGGTLENWSATQQNVGPDATDSDGDPTTHEAGAAVTAGQLLDTIDFGYTIPSSYTVKKELAVGQVNPTRPGQKVKFKITVENTGKTWLSTVPLVDTYNGAFLTYGFGGEFATPDSEDHVNDNVLNWSDLTQAGAKGFGIDLEPGHTFEVFVTFTAYLDTGVAGTENTVTVSGVAVDPDGPQGPLPPAVPPQTPQTGSATIRILNPTGEEIAGFAAAAQPEGVVITWETLNEARILGFNILRQAADSETVQANAELIFAEQAGANAGAGYSYVDGGLPDGTYTYILQIVRLDGTSENYAMTVTVRTASGG
jgi:hypothetical protein